MKIISLSKKQLEYFKELDPFEFRLKNDIDLTLQLGAVFEAPEKDMEGDLLAGLLLGTEKASSLILLWLYVDPLCRRKGIGEKLLFTAFEEAQKKGLRQVAALFPQDYGRELVCSTEREYFALHGFSEEKKGMMSMPVEAFKKETSLSVLTFSEEAFALRSLLEEAEEDEEMPLKTDYDDKGFFDKTHKDWEIKRVNLKDFSENKNLHKAGMHILRGEAPVKVGNIGELTLPQYKQVLSLCEKNGHSGFPEELFDIPADYFDLDVSSFVQEDMSGNNENIDESVCGVCLIHYNRKEKALYVELLFAVGKDYIRSLGELIRCSMIAAIDKYPPDTTVVLPCDRQYHGSLMDKLFEE